jgi:hypothetical protein
LLASHPVAAPTPAPTGMWLCLRQFAAALLTGQQLQTK